MPDSLENAVLDMAMNPGAEKAGAGNAVLGGMVGVVVPCYQVEPHLLSVVVGLPSYVDQVVLVDDGSTDGTGRVAAELARADSRVTVVKHERNSGVGAAVKTGLRFLQQRGCDVMVKLDGDGQMDPQQMRRLIEPLLDEWADYAKGNRLSTKAHFRSMPLLRLLGSLCLTFMTKLASGYWQVLDPQNGYLAITAKALARIDIEELDDGYFFENSMLVSLNISGAKCMDISMPAQYGHERSSLSLGRTALSFPPKLLKGFARRILHRYVIRDFSPIVLLLLGGLVLVSGGGVWGAYHWWISQSTGVPASAGTVMLSVLPIFSGLQLLLQALALDIENARAVSVEEESYHRERRFRHPVGARKSAES